MSVYVCESAFSNSSRILIVCYATFDANSKENVANSHTSLAYYMDRYTHPHTLAHTQNRRETLAKCSGKYEIVVHVRLCCLYFFLLWANFVRRKTETGE